MSRVRLKRYLMVFLGFIIVEIGSINYWAVSIIRESLRLVELTSLYLGVFITWILGVLMIFNIIGVKNNE